MRDGSRRDRPFPLRAQVALLGVAFLAVAALWGYLLTTTPEPEPFAPSSQSGSGAAPGLRVTFAGDGFTAATPSGGNGAAAYPVRLAQRFGWQVTTVANDGVGYLTTGGLGLTLPALTNQIVESRPDVLVVFAGRADVGENEPEPVAAAARSFYDRLRTQLPATRFVVVGPVATDAIAPAGADELRNALATEVGRTPNAAFVDPLEEGWFADAPEGAIADDGQHPTDVGHQVVADKLGASLTAPGVAPVGPAPS